MPPKLEGKKGAAAAAAAKKTVNESSIGDDNVLQLNRQVEALQMQLVRESQRAIAADNSSKDLRIKLIELQRDYQEEKSRSYSLSSDMTRQYKSMREELTSQINSLQQQLSSANDIHQQSLLQSHNEKDQLLTQLASKEKEIEEEKRLREEVTREFETMLKSTMDKMRERMELTNEWESERTDEPKIKTLEEFHLGRQKN